MTTAPTCGRPRHLRVDGLDLRLHEWGGEGAPGVLLLHSLAAHGHWWDAVATRLESRHHLIALDLRGHGGSSWVPGDGGRGYTFEDYSSDIVAVIDRLGWRRPVVIGHSLGGYLAVKLAADHGDRVGAAVGVDFLTGFDDEMMARATRQAERPGPEFDSVAEGGRRFRLAPVETTAPVEILRHLGETGVVERSPGVWQYAFDRRVFRHPRPDPWAFLPRIACPLLVIRGERSPIMSREAAERVAGTVADGTMMEMPGTFHHLVLDDPDGFAARVEAWLATRRQGSA